jgi:hypothetical protein
MKMVTDKGKDGGKANVTTMGMERRLDRLRLVIGLLSWFWLRSFI